MPTIALRRFRDLGTVIRTVRVSQGLTQDELARSLAFDRNYLSRLESGTPTMHVSRLFRLLDRLGIRLSVTYDLGGGDERP